MILRQRLFKFKNIVPIFSFILGCYLATIFNVNNCTSSGTASATFSRSTNNKNDKFLLLILILSSPTNFHLRQTIRETWFKFNHQFDADATLVNSIDIPQYQENGFLQQDTVDEQRYQFELYRKILKNQKATVKTKRKFDFLPRFVIGMANLPSVLTEAIKLEQKQHADLLLLDNFEDTYTNLTQKLLLSIERSISVYQFKYLLKCDDDTYVRLEQILTELDIFDMKLTKHNYAENPHPMLYWGYFNGRAQVKHSGKWMESNFDICDRYLPYALGGGYILSQPSAKFIADNHRILSAYNSEDISIGVWLSMLRNVYRKHDVRFDTGYIPRNCRDYHVVLHKRTMADMQDLQRGVWCNFKSANDSNVQRPKEYFYNWNKSPLQCCNNLNN